MTKEKSVLHLMVNNTCTNDCPLCCNKQYDVDDVPIVSVKELREAETICLTGGAPMFDLEALALFTSRLERHYPNIKTVYIYANGAELFSVYNIDIVRIRRVFENFPCNTKVRYGLTLSPKCKNDWKAIREFSRLMQYWQSNRIYCFSDKEETEATQIFPDGNVEIVRRKWQRDFKPAPNTIFRRLPVWIV